MKTLRLFVTGVLRDDWPHKTFDNVVEPKEVIASLDYDEIIICGGEPFVFKRNLERLLQAIFTMNEVTGIKRKVFVETSLCDFWKIDDLIKLCDGIICMPKTKADMAYFKQCNNELLKRTNFGKFTNKTMQLNILPSVRDFFPENLRVWQVTYLESDEVEHVGCDYMRIAEPWKEETGWYDLTR